MAQALARCSEADELHEIEMLSHSREQLVRKAEHAAIAARGRVRETQSGHSADDAWVHG
jgi:hypothetical protein